MIGRGILLWCFVTAIALAYPTGWSEDILISPDTSKIKGDPDVYIDSHNQVWASWEYVVSSMHCEIYFTKLDSLGNCLIPETNLSNNTTNSTLPRIAVDTTDNIHFIWGDDSPMGIGIWYAKLANDGSVLISPHLAVSGAGTSSSWFETVLNKRQELNIASSEAPSGYNQITFTRLDNDGNPLIPYIQVSPVGFNALRSGIGIDSFENYHFGYRNDTTGIPYRFMYTKMDKNTNITIPQKVFSTGEKASIIADRSQNIHIVYGDYSWHIQYIKMDQVGNVLVGPRQLTSYRYNSSPRMAMDSLYYLHVVWDLRGDSMGIMYCKLDTMGDFVIPPMKIVYPPPYGYIPINPRIVVDWSNRLHLVWQDQRLSHTQIFYKRGENDIINVNEGENRGYKSIFIYAAPNPFHKEIKINYSSYKDNTNKNISIYNISGQEVMRFNLANSSGSFYWNGYDRNGYELPAGVYLIRINTKDTFVLQKIIKY